MKVNVRTTVTVTTFFVEDPPDGGAGIGQHHWQAIATAHRYNGEVRPAGLPTQEHALLSGLAFEAITTRVSADAEETAAKGALKALFDRLALSQT
jgi:hypothetical protein